MSPAPSSCGWYKESRPFLEQMESHKDDVPVECGFVPLLIPTPVFDDLNADQLRYYIYWRNELRMGRFRKTAYGYLHLRLCEFANGSDPVDDACVQLDIIARSAGNLEQTVKAFTAEYGLANDRDIGDGICRGELGLIMTSKMMAHPPVPLDLGTAYRMSGSDIDMDVSEHEYNHIEALFNASLRAIDDRLVRDTGRGLEEIHGKRAVREITLLEGYRREKGIKRVVEFYLFPSGSLDRFLEALIIYCYKTVCGQRVRVRIPSVLTKEMKDVVDAVARGAYVSEGDDTRREWNGYRIVKSSEEGLDGPRLFDLPDSMTFQERIGSDLGKQLRRHWGIRAEGTPNYTPSGSLTPLFNGMNADQLNYYYYFRQKALERDFVNGDPGYLWLLMTDLVNREPDQEYLETMISASETYSPFMKNGLAAQTASEFAAFHNLYVRPNRCMSTYVSDALTLTQILDGKEGYLLPESILRLGSIEQKSIADDFDGDCGEITTDVLRRINGTIDIRSDCGLEETHQWVSFFNHLGFANSNSVQILTFDYRRNSIFRDGLLNIVKAVEQGVRAYRSGKKPKYPNLNAFGTDISDTVSDAVDAYFSVKGVKRSENPIFNSAYDRDVSESAGLLSLDDSVFADAVTIEDKGAGTVPFGADIWSAFAGSLTDLELEYIACLMMREDAEEVLSIMGCTGSQAQDIINSKAMDFIGDNVMENGSVVAEYEDDMGRCLEEML